MANLWETAVPADISIPAGILEGSNQNAVAATHSGNNDNITADLNVGATTSGNLFSAGTFIAPPPTIMPTTTTIPFTPTSPITPVATVRSGDIIPPTSPVHQTKSAGLEDSFSLSTGSNFSTSPLSIWEQEQAARLQQKSDKEAERRKDLQQKAKAALLKSKEERDEKNAKTRQQNKLAETSNPPSQLKGKDWEKVGQLVDLSEKGKRGERDISRFKAILIELKAGK